jgi:hypothetical protein
VVVEVPSIANSVQKSARVFTSMLTAMSYKAEVANPFFHGHADCPLCAPRLPEPSMPDDKSRSGGQDRIRNSFEQDYEVRD